MSFVMNSYTLLFSRIRDSYRGHLHGDTWRDDDHQILEV